MRAASSRAARRDPGDGAPPCTKRIEAGGAADRASAAFDCGGSTLGTHEAFSPRTALSAAAASAHGASASSSITCTAGTAAGETSGQRNCPASSLERIRGQRARASNDSAPRLADSTAAIASTASALSAARSTDRNPWSGGGRGPASHDTNGKRTRPRFFHTTASCGGEPSAKTQ